MIKKKTIVLTSTPEVLDIEKIVPGPTAEINKKIQLLEGEIVYQLESSERFKVSAADYLARAQEFAEKAVEQAQKKEQLQKRRQKIDLSLYASTLEKQKTQLSKNPFLEKIHAVSDELYCVTFRPVFTHIRTGDGSTTTKRRCIGGFRVYVPASFGTHIKGENTTFTRHSYPHWSINSERLCQGDWQPLFDSLRTTGDIVGLVNALHEYLVSTLDSGAYARSHNWLRDSRAHLQGENNMTFAVGDTVICTFNNLNTPGIRGVVTSIDWSNNQQYIKWGSCKTPEGSQVRSVAVWDKADNFRPISRLVFRRLELKTTAGAIKVKYDTRLNKEVDERLEALDKAPQGITNDEALKIITG